MICMYVSATKTVALPADIIQALNIARTVSHWMFGLFLTSIILIFLCVVLTPLSVSSLPRLDDQQEKYRRTLPKRLAFPFVFLTFFAFFTTVIASILATAMFTIFSIVFTNNAADLNISADLGVRMLVFMWIAVALTAVGFVLQARNLCGSSRKCCFLMCCCCCLPCLKKRPKFARSRALENQNDNSDGADRGGVVEGEKTGSGKVDGPPDHGLVPRGIRSRGNNNVGDESRVSRRWRAMRFGL